MSDPTDHNISGALVKAILISAGIASVALMAYLLPKRISPVILQHPDEAPGRWEKTVIVGYDSKAKGYRMAVFDNGMDFVSNSDDGILSLQDVQKIIVDQKNRGYVERDVKMWGEHYGITV
jgi:hypothetical protein